MGEGNGESEGKKGGVRAEETCLFSNKEVRKKEFDMLELWNGWSPVNCV